MTIDSSSFVAARRLVQELRDDGWDARLTSTYDVLNPDGSHTITGDRLEALGNWPMDGRKVHAVFDVNVYGRLRPRPTGVSFPPKAEDPPTHGNVEHVQNLVGDPYGTHVRHTPDSPLPTRANLDAAKRHNGPCDIDCTEECDAPKPPPRKHTMTLRTEPESKILGERP